MFKEKYMEEKIKIFTRQKIHLMKLEVLEKSLILVIDYLKQNQVNQDIKFDELEQVLKKI